jgi:pimeloyl-ACP methyl ester carboxylesterase
MDHPYSDPPARRSGCPQAHGLGGHTAAVPSRRTLLAASLGTLAASLSGCAVERVAAGASLRTETRTETHSFVSRARRGVRTTWSLLRPADAPGDLSVVVALHGLGQDHTILHSLGAEHALAGTGRSFALVAPDGGTSYWHPHGGEDAGAMVTDELLPRLAAQGLRTERIGLIGWSMGGYGALRLAGLLGPTRVAGVAAVSPALWTDPASASRSGFSSADEYRRSSVMHDQAELAGISVRVDCGRTDPFAQAVRVYRAGFAHRPSGGFSFGSHDRGYWRRMLPEELAFLGGSLAP